MINHSNRWLARSTATPTVFGLIVIIMLLLVACVPLEMPAGTEPAAEATAPAEEEMASDGMMADLVGDPVAGQYIALQTGGCGCHNNGDLGGLAGGNDFETPTGVAYASNITSDVETGIGGWTEAQLAHALLTGATPDEQLHPVMPYMRFSAFSQQEAMDVAAWMLSLEPIVNAVPERELSEEPAAYTPMAESPISIPTDAVERGAQLVALANCAGCHTPKNEDGSPMADMMLAGAPIRDEFALNITPDVETGIGGWSEEEIATYMRTGTEPDGTQVEGAMASQIDRRFGKLTEGDSMAIAAFLKSIPAVVNAAPSE